MNKTYRIFISILVAICFYFTLLGFSLIMNYKNKLTVIFFVTVFLLILAIISVVSFKRKNFTTNNSKNLMKYFWIIFVLDLIFLFYVGFMYFTYYSLMYGSSSSKLIEYIANFLTSNLDSFLRLFLIIISISLGFFFYYLLSPES